MASGAGFPASRQTRASPHRRSVGRRDRRPGVSRSHETRARPTGGCWTDPETCKFSKRVSTRGAAQTRKARRAGHGAASGRTEGGRSRSWRTGGLAEQGSGDLLSHRDAPMVFRMRHPRQQPGGVGQAVAQTAAAGRTRVTEAMCPNRNQAQSRQAPGRRAAPPDPPTASAGRSRSGSPESPERPRC